MRLQNSALASDLGLWFEISCHSLDSLETYPDLQPTPISGGGVDSLSPASVWTLAPS